MTESNPAAPFPDDTPRLETLPEGVRLTLPGGPAVLSTDEALALAAALVDASAVASGSDPDELDWRRVPVQYLEFEAEQDADEEAGTEGGFASVRCWIRGQTRANAVYVAIGWITDEGWTITNLLEQREVTRADCAGSEDERYSELVLTDGVVFVFEIAGADAEAAEGGPAAGDGG